VQEPRLGHNIVGMPVIVAPDASPAGPLSVSREVFILGAGFSKAISKLMPTLDQLGHRIAEPFQRTPSFDLLPPGAIAALKQGRMPGGSLEVWLSNLATPAPFLNEAERLHNLAMARELVALIVGEIERSERDTLKAPMPHWLARLVTLWDRLAATVITFNYDTLVEQGINAAGMPWISQPQGGEPIQGLAVPLLKMHGSTNWWWIPSDRVGTTVQPAPLAGRWSEPLESNPIAGMEHFVVPPLATKSEYYDLNITRDAWQSARESLKAASRVILMGYSAPVTDLTVASLLSSYADPDVPCLVVDTSPTDVVDRIRLLGLNAAAPFDGEEPIRRFVEQYENDVSRTVATPLLAGWNTLDVGPDDPVVARIAGSTNEPRLPITEIQTQDDATQLIAARWQSGEDVAERAIKARELKEAIEDTSRAGRRLILKVPDQADRAVLHLARRTYARNWLAVEA